MYRHCIACVARCVVKTQIGQTMEYFKASILTNAGFAYGEHKNLNYRIVSVIAWHIAPAATRASADAHHNPLNPIDVFHHH